MRSPFAYTPRPGPLQAASPAAAVTYLGALVAVAFIYSSPLVLVAVAIAAALAGRLAGAAGAVRSATRLGLLIALPIVLVNALVVDRGETVLARLGEWPLLGRVDITLEALADGAVFGLRAVAVMIVFAVYSACVDPDRVLRALRPLAGRSALTATLVSRLVPVAAADAGRLRDAARLRGPGAAEAGRAPLARRLLAGSLDRAVDVAATLELRGYALDRRRSTRVEHPESSERQQPRKVEDLVGSWQQQTLEEGARGAGRSGYRQVETSTRPWWGQVLEFGSRYDGRFYATGAIVLLAAIAGEFAGADGFDAYPTIRVDLGAATLALAALVVLSGLAPLRRRAKRRPSLAGRPPASQSPPRGPGAAPAPGAVPNARPAEARAYPSPPASPGVAHAANTALRPSAPSAATRPGVAHAATTVARPSAAASPGAARSDAAYAPRASAARKSTDAGARRA